MKHYGIHDARIHLKKLPTFQTNNINKCVMADSRMREREEREEREAQQKKQNKSESVISVNCSIRLVNVK